jgi:hypothetical protein
MARPSDHLPGRNRARHVNTPGVATDGRVATTGWVTAGTEPGDNSDAIWLSPSVKDEERRARGWWQRIARGEQRTHLRLAQRNRRRLVGHMRPFYRVTDSTWTAGLGVWQTERVGFQHTVQSRPHRLRTGRRRARFCAANPGVRVRK